MKEPMREGADTHQQQQSTVSVDRRSARSVVIATAVLVLAAAVSFYFVRSTLGLILDRSPSLETEPVVLEPEDVELPLEHLAAQVDLWSQDEVADRVEQVAADLDALARAGHSELPDFAKLSAGGDIEKTLFTARWRAWRRIWLNRVGVIEDLLAPLEQCSRYGDFAELCTELSNVTAELRSVAAAQDVELAGDILERTTTRLEALASSPEEGTEESREESGHSSAAESP